MNHSISTMTGKTKIKIVFLGGQAVGKSSIIEKYIHDRFDQSANPTVGIDFLAKNISHKAKNYRLQLWDTAGQERFRSLIPSYLKDAHCALIVFDVVNRATLAETEMWANLFAENKVGDSFVFLVGNKIDLQHREVTPEEGQEKANSLGVSYFEISAKSGQNIDELFMKLIEQCANKTANATTLGDKKVENKSEPIKQEQSGKVNPDQTDIKMNDHLKKAAEGMVLKNEKISSPQKRKGCC